MLDGGENDGDRHLQPAKGNTRESNSLLLYIPESDALALEVKRVRRWGPTGDNTDAVSVEESEGEASLFNGDHVCVQCVFCNKWRHLDSAVHDTHDLTSPQSKYTCPSTVCKDTLEPIGLTMELDPAEYPDEAEHRAWMKAVVEEFMKDSHHEYLGHIGRIYPEGSVPPCYSASPPVEPVPLSTLSPELFDQKKQELLEKLKQISAVRSERRFNAVMAERGTAVGP